MSDAVKAAKLLAGIWTKPGREGDAVS